MASLLKTIGLGLLALCAVLLLGSKLVLDYSEEQITTHIYPLVYQIGKPGIALLVIGFIVSFLQKAGRSLRHSKCVRCGKSIPRGRIYCFDHQQEVAEHYRNRLRDVEARKGSRI
jgi:recombinational DNA repair protein (RecF pathway)